MLGRLGQKLGSRSGMLPCSSTILEGNQRSFAVLSGKGTIQFCDIVCESTLIVDFIAAQYLVRPALSLVALICAHNGIHMTRRLRFGATVWDSRFMRESASD